MSRKKDDPCLFRLIGIALALLVVALVALSVGAAPAAKLRSLVLKPGDGVLVKCNGDQVSTVPDGQYQVFVWCDVAPPTNTPTATPVLPTDTPIPPTATDTPAGPTDTPTSTDTPAPPTATPTPGAGNTYYLEPGDSFSAVVDMLGPGDEVVLLPGIHTTTLYMVDIHGEPNSPIVIRGVLDGDGAFLTLMDDSYLSVRNSTHVLVKDLDMVHNDGSGSIQADPDKAGRPYIEDVTWRNIRMRDLLGGDGQGAMCLLIDNEPNTDGVFDVLIEGLQCIRNSKPSDAGGNDAVYIGDWPGRYPGDYAPMDGITIRDCWAEDIGGQCVDIKPNVSSLLIDNLTCLRTGRQGNSPGGIILHGNGVEIRNSKFLDVSPGLDYSGGRGIYFGDHEGWFARDVYVHNNVVTDGPGCGICGSTSVYEWRDDIVSTGNTVTGFGGNEYWGYSTAAEACERYGLECP